MTRLLRAGFALLALSLFAAPAFADPSGGWSLPHRAIVDVAKRGTGIAFVPNGYRDTLVFALEGNASTKPDSATLYGAGFDTTAAFALSDVFYTGAAGDTTGRTNNLGPTTSTYRYGVAVADSNYMFTLLVTPISGSTIAIGDTLFVTFQYSYDGQAWIYENAYKSVPSRVRPLLPQLTVASTGGTSRNTNWVHNFYSNNLASTTSGPASWAGAMYGRFLIRLGASSAPQTVTVKAIKASTAPDRQSTF